MSAREALDLGGADDVADCFAKHGLDAELWVVCLATLSSLAAIPRGLQTLCDGAAGGHLVNGVRTLVTSLDFGAPGAGEECARLVRGLALLGALARQDASSFVRSGGMGLLTALLAPPPLLALQQQQRGLLSEGSSNALPSAAAYPHLATLLAAGGALLDRATRSKVGLDALLAQDGAVVTILALTTTDLSAGSLNESLSPGGGGSSSDLLGSARKPDPLRRLGSMRGARSFGGSSTSLSPAALSIATPTRGNGGALSIFSPAGGGALGSTLAPGTSGRRDLNAHLEPALRVCDRLARSGGDAGMGREALLAAGASNLLAALWTLASAHGRRTEALAMRLLVCLLGGDLSNLIGRMEGHGTGGLAERILCARLLASIVISEKSFTPAGLPPFSRMRRPSS